MKKSLIWVVGTLAMLGTTLVQAAPARTAAAKTTLVRTHKKTVHKKHLKLTARPHALKTHKRASSKKV